MQDNGNGAHELLLGLAGRLPDRTLWRYRDWLAAGALDAVAAALPLTLLRERIAVTLPEFRLLTGSLTTAGGHQDRLNAVPWVEQAGEVGYLFSPVPPNLSGMGDPTAVVLSALLRDRPEVVSARVSWRQPSSGYGDAARVLLVTASSGWVRLTGELQRVLRALGVAAPCVEVLPQAMVPPPYHQAALAASESLVPDAVLVAS